MWRNVLSNCLLPILGSEIQKEDTWPHGSEQACSALGWGAAVSGTNFYREHTDAQCSLSSMSAVSRYVQGTGAMVDDKVTVA